MKLTILLVLWTNNNIPNPLTSQLLSLELEVTKHMTCHIINISKRTSYVTSNNLTFLIIWIKLWIGRLNECNLFKPKIVKKIIDLGFETVYLGFRFLFKFDSLNFLGFRLILGLSYNCKIYKNAFIISYRFENLTNTFLFKMNF